MKWLIPILIVSSIFLQGCFSAGHFMQGLAQRLSGQRSSVHENENLDYQRRQAEAAEQRVRYEKYGF